MTAHSRLYIPYEYINNLYLICIELSAIVYGRYIIHNYLLYMIPCCNSNYFVSIGDPTVHLTTVLIGSVFFEGLKMTQKESKHVAHVSYGYRYTNKLLC